MSILDPNEARRRQELTQKLKNDTLTENEGFELRDLLAKAKTNAEKSENKGDVILAILVLLGLLAVFLAAFKK